MSKKKGRLIIISAPSGAGKGTVIKEIRKLRPEISFSVSATTRKPRIGEKNGREYHFLSIDEFEAMVQRGEFLEYEGYAGSRYGTPAKPIEENSEKGIDTILEIELKGARTVRHKKPEAVSIFIMPPSIEELRSRLTKRGTNTKRDLENRMRIAQEEIAAAFEYEHIVINDDFKRAAREIIDIVDNKSVDNQ